MYLVKAPRATFTQLRSFAAVAELGGITRASEALHLTQPTISGQLRELSESLGVELLMPSGRGVALTDEGRQLQATVAAMFSEWRNFEETVADLRGLARGTLRIAGVTTTEYFLAQWLKPFAAAYPGIDIDLAIENRDAVVRRLEQDQDDVAVMMMPPSKLSLETMSVMDNPLVLIAPINHPWSLSKTVPFKTWASASLLMREQGSGTRQAALEFFEAKRVEPLIRMTLGSNEAIKHAVAAGLGLAIISRHTLAAKPEREGLCILPAAGLPIKRQWQLVWRRDRQLPRVAARFVEFMRQSSALL
ncbi:MAG: LysR family transcriptional regulator [Betaproteobacteria bacterium]|nr:MAG: LysR family transcriptional regulator [Betaproteobacteria bacterium]